MKLAGSLEKAQAIGPGQHAKARDLHYDLENELEHGLYDEDESDEGERAIAHLEAHHPGVREASRGLTRPPALSSSAKRSIDERSAEPDLAAAPSSSSGGGSSAQPRGSSSGSRGGGRRNSGGSAGRRAFGTPDEDLSGAIIRGLQFLLAAGVAYQVLQPKGSGALSSVLGSVGSGVRNFVRPVDPFASSSSTAPDVTPPAGLPTASGFPNTIDTPTGPAPYNPGTLNLGGSAGVFDTPGGVAPYKPPSAPGLKIINFPATGPAGSHVKQPSSPLSLNIRLPALF